MSPPEDRISHKSPGRDDRLEEAGTGNRNISGVEGEVAMDPFEASKREFDRTGADFLFTELDMTTTLIGLGESFTDPGRKNQAFQDAVKGYQTAAHFATRTALNTEELDYVRQQLERLLSSLQKNGIAVDAAAEGGEGE